MPEGGEGELDEAPPPPPPPIGGKAMDLDLDMEVSWSFDAAAFLSDSPPPEYFLASPSSTPAPSPSPQSSLQVPHSSSLQSAGVGLDDNATELSLPDLHNFVTGTSDEANDALPSVRSDAQPVSKLAEDETYDVSCIIKGKMAQALRRFKEATSQRVLIQVWAPVMSGGRQVLTTSEQPFMLDPHCISLLQYRTASLTYLFSVDGDSDGYLGLPGRVFCQQFPEWTPDVQYYSSKEYPRLTHALNYNVKGSLALPVFEPFRQKCVGVVELIMTSPKINYAVEVDRVCKALEVVNLKSTEILSFPSMRIFNEGHQAAMSEILEVLTTICEMHKLPLAQTWVPRGHGKGLPHSIKDQNTTDGREQSRLSTTDAAFYVVEPCMWGFRDACAEHHLQKGQGVAGMAYSLCKPCFSSDVTRFGKDSYPLVHYARMFGLAGCFALCLQSCRTRDDIYVVEFFLPGNCRGEAEQLTILEAILSSVRRSSRTLNFFLKKEIEGEALSEILRVDGDLESPKIPLVLASSGSNDKESTRKSDHEKGSVTLIKEERRRGKAEKTISLEVLRNYFAGSLKEAAKSLGVCPTTMKRICRQHGISRWPSRKIKKVNRSLSKLKRVIESVQGPEGAFDLLPSLAGSWPEKRKSSGIEKANELPGIDLGTSCSPSQRDFPSQRDSQGSCPGENPQRPLERSPSVHEGLIEDSVSSKELNNPVLSFNTNDSLDAEVNTSSSTVKIKANYRGNIIRFSLEFGAGLFFLKEQVAQRLKLDLGAFDLRYLDDEGEWVLLACDVDLEECLEFSNGQVIRLSVVDFAGPHGSSSSQSS